MKKTSLLLITGLLGLTACDLLYDPTTKPDYTIHVMPTATGMVAIPPDCPTWSAASVNPYDNQPLPQFGCANARNLALMVERPSDLVKGRDFGNSSPVTTVGAMRRYNNNQTRGLIDPDTSPDTATAVTTAPTPTSSMTGDAAGSGGGAAASSSSSSTAAGP